MSRQQYLCKVSIFVGFYDYFRCAIQNSNSLWLPLFKGRIPFKKIESSSKQWKRNFFPVSCQPAQDVTFFHLFYELGNKLCLIIEYETNFQMTPLYVSTYLHILAASLAVILPLVVMVNNDHQVSSKIVPQMIAAAFEIIHF